MGKIISEWEKIILYIEEKKPDYGTICIELTFHQRFIKKAKILQREEILLFCKEKENAR